MAQKSSELPKKKNPLPVSLFNLDLYYPLYQYFDYEFLPIHVKVVIGSKNTGILIGNTRTELNIENYLGFSYDKNFPIYKPGQIYDLSIDRVELMTRPNIGNSIRLGYQRSLSSGIYANASMVICTIKPRFFTEDIYYSYNPPYYNEYIYITDVYYKRLWPMRLNAGIGYTLSIGKQKRFYFNSEIVYSFFNRILNADSLPIYIQSNNFNINLGFGFRIGSPSKTTYDGIKEVNTVPLKR